MAIVTYTAQNRGATMTITVNDATLRATNVDATATGRQMRVQLLDAQGAVVREVVVLANTTQNVSVNVPARLVEIVKADLTTKSYVVPPFAVFF